MEIGSPFRRFVHPGPCGRGYYYLLGYWPLFRTTPITPLVPNNASPHTPTPPQPPALERRFVDVQLSVSPQCSERGEEKQPGFCRILLTLLVCEEPRRSPCCFVEGRGGARSGSERRVRGAHVLSCAAARAGSSADLHRGQLHKLPQRLPSSVMPAPGSRKTSLKVCLLRECKSRAGGRLAPGGAHFCQGRVEC